MKAKSKSHYVSFIHRLSVILSDIRKIDMIDQDVQNLYKNLICNIDILISHAKTNNANILYQYIAIGINIKYATYTVKKKRVISKAFLFDIQNGSMGGRYVYNYTKLAYSEKNKYTYYISLNSDSLALLPLY